MIHLYTDVCDCFTPYANYSYNTNNNLNNNFNNKNKNNNNIKSSTYWLGLTPCPKGR